MVIKIKTLHIYTLQFSAHAPLSTHVFQKHSYSLEIIVNLRVNKAEIINVR